MLWQRLSLAKTRAVEVAKERLGAIVARLEAVNPEAVLARGYSIVYTRSKHIRSINDVIRDETIDIRVSDGVISGIVRSQRSL
jgi:exodeoxyribonuclease VII large subunit